MSYEQAIKHSKNHRKDRFYQQCSGPTHEPSEPMSAGLMRNLELTSIRRIAEETTEYPIYIKPCGCVYVCVDERNSFATKIASREELDAFIRDYVL